MLYDSGRRAVSAIPVSPVMPLAGGCGQSLLHLATAGSKEIPCQRMDCESGPLSDARAAALLPLSCCRKFIGSSPSSSPTGVSLSLSLLFLSFRLLFRRLIRWPSPPPPFPPPDPATAWPTPRCLLVVNELDTMNGLRQHNIIAFQLLLRRISFLRLFLHLFIRLPLPRLLSPLATLSHHASIPALCLVSCVARHIHMQGVAGARKKRRRSRRVGSFFMLITWLKVLNY